MSARTPISAKWAQRARTTAGAGALKPGGKIKPLCVACATACPSDCHGSDGTLRLQLSAPLGAAASDLLAVRRDHLTPHLECFRSVQESFRSHSLDLSECLVQLPHRDAPRCSHLGPLASCSRPSPSRYLLLCARGRLIPDVYE